MLSHVCFYLMNSVNSSTGFSPFQLHMGHLPHVIPPLLINHSIPPSSTYTATQTLIKCIHADTSTTANVLLAAKVAQADFANRHWCTSPIFSISNHVLLSTFHWHCNFHSLDSAWVAKFMPWYDGPYTILWAHPEKSSYILLLSDSNNTFPTFHSSLLYPFLDNNTLHFSFWQLPQSPPYVSFFGIKEFEIESIIDEQYYGCSYQYLML